MICIRVHVIPLIEHSLSAPIHIVNQPLAFEVDRVSRLHEQLFQLWTVQL